MTDNTERLRQQLSPIFSQYPGIQAVYLFGSAATGRQLPHSDLDLALVPRSDAIRRQKLDILADLARAGFENVDLLLLDSQDVVLQYEAVRHNRLIYHTADFEPATFFSNVIRKYLDFLPVLEVQRKAYKQSYLQQLCDGH